MPLPAEEEKADGSCCFGGSQKTNKMTSRSPPLSPSEELYQLARDTTFSTAAASPAELEKRETTLRSLLSRGASVNYRPPWSREVFSASCHTAASSSSSSFFISIPHAAAAFYTQSTLVWLLLHGHTDLFRLCLASANHLNFSPFSLAPPDPSLDQAVGGEGEGGASFRRRRPAAATGDFLNSVSLTWKDNSGGASTNAVSPYYLSPSEGAGGFFMPEVDNELDVDVDDSEVAIGPLEALCQIVITKRGKRKETEGQGTTTSSSGVEHQGNNTSTTTATATNISNNDKFEEEEEEETDDEATDQLLHAAFTQIASRLEKVGRNDYFDAHRRCVLLGAGLSGTASPLPLNNNKSFRSRLLGNTLLSVAATFGRLHVVWPILRPVYDLAAAGWDAEVRRQKRERGERDVWRVTGLVLREDWERIPAEDREYLRVVGADGGAATAAASCLAECEGARLRQLLHPCHPCSTTALERIWGALSSPSSSSSLPTHPYHLLQQRYWNGSFPLWLWVRRRDVDAVRTCMETFPFQIDFSQRYQRTNIFTLLCVFTPLEPARAMLQSIVTRLQSKQRRWGIVTGSGKPAKEEDIVDWEYRSNGADFLSLAACFNRLHVFWPLVRDLPYFQDRIHAFGAAKAKTAPLQKQQQQQHCFTLTLPVSHEDWDQLEEESRQLMCRQGGFADPRCREEVSEQERHVSDAAGLVGLLEGVVDRRVVQK